MVESILDMKREMMNSLKRIGKVDLWLHSDEIELFVDECFETISIIHRTFCQYCNCDSISCATVWSLDEDS